MHSVFIVDDESWIVDGLKISIDWEKHGFEVVGEAYNGANALELISKLKPDIVFTDIRMPGMNGLELIKKVKDIYFDIQFIVISGYAEFAYAQKALSNGAIGYCLKPFDESEILTLLNKSKQILSRYKRQGSEELVDLLSEWTPKNQDVMGQIIKEKYITQWDKSGYFSIVSFGTLQMPESVKFLPIKAGIDKKVYLVFGSKFESIRSFIENQLSREVRSIGVSSSVNELSKMKNAIEEANIAVYSYFVSGKKGVYELKNIDLDDINVILREMDKAIQSKDTLIIEKCFESLNMLFSTGTYNIRSVFKVYNLILSFIYRLSSDDEISYFDSYEQLVDCFENVFSMLSYLREMVLKQSGISNNIIDDEIENKTVKKVLEYVNNNFFKQISIKSISEMFYINPNYISHIFKKETGENFTEYLSKIRVLYACDMLRDSKLPVQQISENSGFNDYFYFARIFKKITAKTPTQYRNEVLK